MQFGTREVYECDLCQGEYMLSSLRRTNMEAPGSVYMVSLARSQPAASYSDSHRISFQRVFGSRAAP